MKSAVFPLLLPALLGMTGAVAEEARYDVAMLPPPPGPYVSSRPLLGDEPVRAFPSRPDESAPPLGGQHSAPPMMPPQFYRYPQQAWRWMPPPR